MAQADPAAEYPAAALALDAKMRIAGEGGERIVDAADFFVSTLTTALEPGEILIEVRLPMLARGTGWSLLEVSRRHGDFAMAGVAATIALDGGRVRSARIALFGVGPVPVRARAAEQLVAGKQPAASVWASAAALARDAVEEPLSDPHASGAYRRHLAGVLVERALAEAVSRAGTSA
jgi:carbon-monoxide dehydrogenase medium subunit